MNWMFLIVDVFSVLFEVYIISIFFDALSTKEYLKKRYSLLTYLVSAVILSVICCFVSNVWIRLAVNFVFVFLLSCLYKINMVRRVIGAIALFVFFNLTELFVGFILSAILSATVSNVNSNIIYYSVGVFVSKSLALIVVKIFHYKYHSEEIRVTAPFVMAICVFPITTFVVGVVLIGGFGDTFDSAFALAGACSVILLSIANVIVFFIFENYAKQQKIKSDLQFEQVRLQLESDYLSEIVQKQMQANKATHDLKNKLFAIKELVKHDKPEGLKRLNAICDIVAGTQNIIYTGNTEVDALINSKAHTAALDNISLKCHCYFSGFGEIDKMDLCVLIGNLLDNAIEACRNYASERYIMMEILQRANMVNIIIVNPFNGELNVKDNVYLTKKRDKYAHGFGIKSVKSIVDKYGGDIQLFSKNNTFTASVLLPT